MESSHEPAPCLTGMCGTMGCRGEVVRGGEEGMEGGMGVRCMGEESAHCLTSTTTSGGFAYLGFQR